MVVGKMLRWPAPCICSRAGRARIVNVTSAEAGLPGSPKKIFSVRRPKAKGLPGRMAIFHNSNVPPISVKAVFTQSASPTETPPVVMTASHSVSASSKRCGFCGGEVVGDQWINFRGRAGFGNQRGEAGAVAFVDRAGWEGSAGFA